MFLRFILALKLLTDMLKVIFVRIEVGFIEFQTRKISSKFIILNYF